MKDRIVLFVLLSLTLAVGAAAEDLLPRWLGVGFPVLLSAVEFQAARRPFHTAIVFAFIAGAFEDALSGLPPMTSLGYFALVAALVRFVRIPFGCIALTFPCYQVWLWMWGALGETNVFVRFFAALPLGLLTSGVTAVGLLWLDRKAVVDAR